MKLKIWIWFLVCLFGFGFQIAWAEEWYPGIIHAHSRFSDGNWTPEQLVSQAKSMGARFLVVTDHYEEINDLYQFDGSEKWGYRWWGVEILSTEPFDCYGFERYNKRFSNLSSPDFIVIPGAEIATLWGTDAFSHTLALGNLAYKDDKLFEYQFKNFVELEDGTKQSAQQAVINRLNKLGVLPVAAHPNLVTLVQLKRPWEIGNYQFDLGNTKELHGIEFFNDGSEGYPRTLNWHLMLLRQGNDVFVTSGCDSHYYDDPGDSGRWKRKTWVWSEKLDQESLIQSMAQGHTYAANHGASFENLNYMPGFQAQEVERPKFLFFVAFDKKISDSKTIQIYRDGKLIEDSIQTHQKENIKGLQKIAYAWEDKGAEGEHQYVIEVEGVLITSPIRLKIRIPFPPTTTAVIEGKYFSQEYPEDYLELRRDRTATWDCHYDISPDDVRWKLSENKDGLYIYSPTETRWKREFLIKGNGVIVRSYDGTAWVKEGVRYAFSAGEVSGDYKADMKKLPPILPRYNVEVEVTWKCWPAEGLVLRPDGTCTYTMDPIIAAGIKVRAEGRWEINGNRIWVELDLLGRREKSKFRVLDRDILIQEDRGIYKDWVRQGVGRTYEAMAISKQFSLSSDFGDEEELTFEVATPGTITLEAIWTSAVGPVNLALILNGPGQTGYYSRKDGYSPLQVEYNVTSRDVAKGKSWIARIVNFSRQGPVNGTLKAIYPVGSGPNADTR